MRTAHLARFLFWGALAFALYMAWTPQTVSVGDKYLHMLAFGTLTILACAGYPEAELLRLGERLSFLGALIEVVQAMPAVHRDCDIMDWVADTAVVAGVLVVVWVVRRRRAA
jgi:Na+/H+-dicarboxylate symporter